MPYDVNMAEGSSAVLRPRRTTQRPASWFMPSTTSLAALAVAGATEGALSTPAESTANPFRTGGFQAPPPTSFRSPASSIKGKHKLSPSPSPRNHDYDFVISSPRPGPPSLQIMAYSPSKGGDKDAGSSSPVPADSPTPAYNMATAAAKLRLADDDSPIRHVPGHSRSLAAARSRDDLFSPKARGSPGSARHQSLVLDDHDEPPIPLHSQVSHTPLFTTLRTSQSQDCSPWRMPNTTRIPRLSVSHPIRPRKANDRAGGLAQKKAVSLGDIQVDNVGDSPFGSAFVHGRKPRSSLGNLPVGFSGRQRRSAGPLSEQSISRSVGHKSGLSLSLSQGLAPMPDFSTSNSSISSSSTTSITPPASAESMFENVKPNPEVFEAAASGIKQKFKPRDSSSSNLTVTTAEEDRVKMPPPSVLRVNTLPVAGPSVKRARSLGHRPDGDEAEAEMLAAAMLASQPEPTLASKLTNFGVHGDDKLTMPGTPVKRNAFNLTHPRSSGRVVMSISQPVLGSDGSPSAVFSATPFFPPPSTRKALGNVPHLTVTTTSSPDSAMDTDEASPTTHLGSASKAPQVATRLNLLRRLGSTGGSSSLECSEDEGTPTKGGSDRHAMSSSYGGTPTPSPKAVSMLMAPNTQPKDTGVVPRLSLPTFGTTKSRRVRHRQSHPVAPPNLPEEDDIFESRFVVMHPLGKGAFSTVLQVQERFGDGVYAVKKTRGVFDGVMDRLRHLEEIDVLRHLSKDPNPHIIRFVDAWEQNRQLYIQTEACVGSLAAFLEVFGHENERLDEARVWKMVRDLSDGIHHIHSHGVIHFDIKPDNILVAADRTLKLADFGLATRWPRLSPAEIIEGSGLGGSIGVWKEDKLEREGDRIYMPPEMLRGVFVMAADIFSFGLVVLESAMNIYLPDGGPSWHALRENNFTWLDLSPLSPALTDLIVSCMNADPQQRPSIEHIVEHPIIQRTLTGGAALAPEDPRWLVDVLAGTGSTLRPALGGLDGEGDVVMGDA
ncbi:uncharacterized protein EHS24_005333 [Apiotrichum porosum]|uniref:Protein kinase domain-containing protein n=1 Tax=Apiotrichum porosum TaxID=105984 RepID=A0A427XD28_9TREE|nr:uncharacterized protein EHS24_005333 [Apiotrichum porosum]RSH76755.1 hypothetical protein EHS24_005333 [Apiotrichum porosum]